MRHFLLALLILTFTPATHAQVEDETVDRLLKIIRKELPQGWVAEYEKEYKCLSVERIQPTLIMLFSENMSPDSKPELRKFEFGFRILPFLTPNKYDQLTAENKQIHQEVSKIYDALIARHVLFRVDSFLPETDLDKADVARYKALKSSRHRLPDFYFRSISLEWVMDRPDDNRYRFEDETIRAECYRTVENVEKLLNKYDTHSAPK